MARKIEATIRAKKKYANIKFDIEPHGLELAEQGAEQLRAIVSVYKKGLRKSKAGTAGITLSIYKRHGDVEVLKEHAEEMKAKVDAVLNSPKAVQRIETKPLW